MDKEAGPGSLERIGKNGMIENSSRPSTAPSHRMRSILAQSLATLINSLSLVTLGFIVVFPSVVISYVLNAEGSLSLNEEQVSWYASFLPIFQPVGCIFGGYLQNFIGRKHGLLLMNLVTIATWLMLYTATSVQMLYLTAILMGISIGLAETPSGIYVCEISTPKLRGTLVMLDNSGVGTGIMLTFLVTSLLSWRSSCLICMSWCVFTILLLAFIPDSPVWLIRKGKTKQAIKALCWLRGWVEESNVVAEYGELNQFISESSIENSVNERSDDDSIWKQKYESIRNGLLNTRTWRPYVLLSSYMSFATAASLQGVKPYILVIFGDLNLPVGPTWLAFMNSLASLIGAFACVATVRMLGKRMLALVSMMSTSFISVLLGLYILYEYKINQPWIFVILYIVQGFTITVVITIPWILMGEVYPVKTRPMAAGITGATYYLITAFYVKTYIHFRSLVTIPGTFIIYGVIGLIGFFYLWVFMPETEGKTMAEIEELFVDDARKSCSHFRKKK